MTLAYRTMRGNILAATFEAEYKLYEILTEIFFPAAQSTNNQVTNDNAAEFPAPVAVLRLDFDKVFLKDRRATSGQKIDLFCKVRKSLQRLSEAAPEELVSRLRQANKWRNKFPHCSVTFVPHGNPPNQTLNAKLVCGGREDELTEAVLHDIDELFASTQSELELESLLTRLKG